MLGRIWQIKYARQNMLVIIIFLLVWIDDGSDADSDVDDSDDATIMGTTVAYTEVEASIRALRYGSEEQNQGKQFLASNVFIIRLL